MCALYTQFIIFVIQVWSVRPASLQCRIRLVCHAQNEPLNMVQPQIYSNVFATLNALETCVHLGASIAILLHFLWLITTASNFLICNTFMIVLLN
jgi:hypothetical protein